jgi:hypothetical protein
MYVGKILYSAHPNLSNMYTDYSHGVKQSGREADRSGISEKGKKEWFYTLTPPVGGQF